MSINIDRYKTPISEGLKEQVNSSPNFSEEDFYRYKIGWGMIFPLLTQEEIETLAWKSFIY